MIQAFLYAPLLKPAIVFIIFISILFIIFSSSSSSPPAFSSGYLESIQQETSTPILPQSDHNNDQQQPNKVIESSGHFANNQIENGTVTWIQGGLWNLEIYNSTTSSPSNPTTSMNNTNISYTAFILWVKKFLA